MSTKLSRRAFLGGAGLLSLSLAACGGNSGSESSDSGESSGSESTASGRVYWLNFKPEIDETLQSLAKTYSDSKGVSVKVFTAASGEYESTLTSEMDKPEPPTLFVIGNQAAVKSWGDFAIDLTGTKIAEEGSTDDFNLYDDQGRMVSQGYCYECFGIIANPDLVTKAGGDLDTIQGFDALKTLAEDIHSRASELGFDAFAPADMDDGNNWIYSGHLANIDYFYEAKADPDAWKECPPTITGDYLPNYKNLFDLVTNNAPVPPSELASGGHDPQTQFEDGKVAFMLQGSWTYDSVAAKIPEATMIPYYCGVDGEDKAGLNSGTENCWAVNSQVSEEDQNATIDFMVWLVTDPDASKELVAQLGSMPFINAQKGDNGFLNDAETLNAADCYTMDWDFNFQPNVNDYRAALVSALNTYDKDQNDANWEGVRTAFVQGWADQYQKANG